MSEQIYKTITAADTGSALAYDTDGNIITDASKATHLMDVLKRVYKKCNNCKKWYLLDSFPKSDSKLSKDGHGSLCKACTDKKKAGKPKEDATNNEPTKRTKAVKVNDGEVEMKYQSFSDGWLINELRRRGFKGTITKSIEL